MKNFAPFAENFLLNKRGKLSLKKVTFFLLFLNVATSAAVSIYIPNLKQMAIDLKTVNALMQMTIVAHLIGEFAGRFLCSQLIDLHGNRAVILPAITISALGHFGCMISTSLSVFILMRFLQAIGASVIYVVSLSVVNKMFSENEKGSVVGILELYQPIAWILSPFAGTIFTEIGSWRLSFFVLLITQFIGIAFFSVLLKKRKKDQRRHFSVAKLFCDYGSILKNSSFVIYALIPGLFAGGYMIFATSCPFICSEFFGHDTADIALFSATPLVFYVMATFAYRVILRKFGIKISKRTGTGIYIIFGVYTILLISKQVPWTPNNLLFSMSLQCVGSAFLVPVSVLKALQSCHHASYVGASTVVVFRNLIMSLCITVSVKFHESITTIMASVFMTVGTVLVLIMARKIIRLRINRQQKIEY
ncbi:MAG: MFS transporter [Holosporaceae bacterium]|jgi:DHA1 family bicyclomycin/chloramphenicol resistance-like MFS transporter|nr:MFS transporter [Holosporaceae bacterium]